MTPSTAHRLCKHADYQLVYKAGRKQFGKQLAYFHAARPAERRSATTGPRIGLTVPKALGKAVRSALPLLTAPVDVILHPRRAVIDLDFAQLKREVSTIFRGVQAAYDRPRQRPSPPTAPHPS
jgi:ribonuclease P protein component